MDSEYLIKRKEQLAEELEMVRANLFRLQGALAIVEELLSQQGDDDDDEA